MQLYEPLRGLLQAGDAPEATFQGCVLLAEDNPINQHVASGMLQQLGLRVDVAADGLTALEQFRQRRYDLVLMDCQMPVMDGFEATRRLRADTTPGLRVPVIALTANAMRGDRERCLAAGMDDYVAKPIRLADLRAVILRWLAPQRPPCDVTAD